MSVVLFWGNTDVGRIRTQNEDSYIIQYIWDENHVLAVVIDGVGGYDGGEVAAELARKCIIEYLENYPNGERLELLKQAVVAANNTILSERSNLPYPSMSCVLTAVLVEIKDMRINMAHVGDTRLYLFVDGSLSKLSHDHSLVGFREEIGELTEEEAMKHPQRNVIGRDVGSKFLEISDKDYIETASFPLLPKSTLLLCSDGLCDMLTSAQMTSILQQEIMVEEKVTALIDAANNAGGKDNVTVVLVDIDLDERVLTGYIEEKQDPVPVAACETDTIADAQGSRKKKNPMSLICLVVLLVCMVGFFVQRGYQLTPWNGKGNSIQNAQNASPNETSYDGNSLPKSDTIPMNNTEISMGSDATQGNSIELEQKGDSINIE